MGRGNVEEIRVAVPCDIGYLIGDFLRKFALRGVSTWQIAGYKVDSLTPNFGFSNGAMSSYLKLHDGRLVLEEDEAPGKPMVKQFNWDGSVFRSGSMVIEGLTHDIGDSILVALHYSNNSNSAKENYEVCKQAVGGEPEGYYVIPSRHVAAKAFRYNVIPNDDRTEWLSIEADYDILKTAYDAAVKSLEGLNL